MLFYRNVDAEIHCPGFGSIIDRKEKQTVIKDYEQVNVFIGVDVGKSEHHAVTLDRAGKVLYDKALPNDETRLRKIINNLKRYGQVLFIVDQPTTKTLPHTLQSIQLADKQVTELSMLYSFDDDLGQQITATSNQIREPLTQIRPRWSRPLTRIWVTQQY